MNDNVDAFNKLKEELDQFKNKCGICKYKKLFDEIKIAVYESSADGKVISANPYMLKMLGYNNLDELSGVDIKSALYFDPSDRDKFIDRVERIGFVKNLELALKKKDGKKIVVSETSFATKDENGVVTYFGILKDITDSKDVEDQLKEYIEKLALLNRDLVKSEEELKILNASKDKFFSIIAHDLRAPFTSLIGLTEFLVDDIENLSNEEIKTFSQKINMASKGIYNLVENLLEWSRLQTGKIDYNPFRFNLSDLADELINTMIGVSVKKKIEVQNFIKKDYYVFADRNMIYSVLQNLVSNALKFTPPGGTITCFGKEEEGFITVIVEDTGIGIKKEDVEKLFRIDMHHSTKGTNEEKGTGLGLILCKELVERNGGSVWVESIPGEGSKFKFKLPVQ